MPSTTVQSKQRNVRGAGRGACAKELLTELILILESEVKSVEVTSYNEGIFHRHGVAVQQIHTNTHTP